MMVLYPPTPLPVSFPGTSIFLAGSIEMGTAIDWQTSLITALQDVPNLTILNPRRLDWDSSWEQTENNPEFVTQVNWEQDGLERASIIVMYLDAKTKSPISLLEFGQVIASGKLIIACGRDFWRRGNLEVMCRRYNIVLHETLEELTGVLQGLLK
jgi:hypothetical protein